MARAYYSTVLDHPAHLVWATIRDFGYYDWAGTDCETSIEEGKPGDSVGAVRATQDGSLRQQLLAHSDLDRSYTYRFLSTPPFAFTDYVATIRISPVIDGNRSLGEWWASFNADNPPQIEKQLAASFAKWFAGLKTVLTDQHGPAPNVSGHRH